MTSLPPRHRTSRLRRTVGLRDLLRETRPHVHDLIAPLFITDDPALVGPIPSLPGVDRIHIDAVNDAVEPIAASGLRGVICFGVPARKDDTGSGSWHASGVIPRALRLLRERFDDLVLMADLCLCQYTTHGHCGLVDSTGIQLDATLEVLRRAAVAYAEAGADMVAPSGMLDGAVHAIRGALDEAGHPHVGILAYTVKHASAFYGPFREAAQSAPTFGDRRSHQLDPANSREALRKAEADLREGADILMVKPALTNLDTLVRLRSAFPHAPLAAYEVSGEYAMVAAAAERGWLNERAIALESLVALRRAGADLVISYRATRLAQWLAQGSFV